MLKSSRSKWLHDLLYIGLEVLETRWCNSIAYSVQSACQQGWLGRPDSPCICVYIAVHEGVVGKVPPEDPTWEAGDANPYRTRVVTEERWGSLGQGRL